MKSRVTLQDAHQTVERGLNAELIGGNWSVQNAVVSSGLEVQAHQDEVMQIFSVVTPEANEMLNNQSDDDEIVVATKTAEDVSMATQVSMNDRMSMATEVCMSSL